MDFLIRLAQMHEPFRKAELEALAYLAQIKLEFSPFCIARLDSADAARALVSRSLLTDAIYELWGTGDHYDALHADVRARTEPRWPDYKHDSFRFSVHGFQGKRDSRTQTAIMESFAYLELQGPIRMKGAAHELCMFEYFDQGSKTPSMLYFGRWIGSGGRNAMVKYDLKKRNYISTTTMDAQLALVTANIALAGPGKFFFDPFMGTGSFPIACSHFGAMCMGSDIDGRSIRGDDKRNFHANLDQYSLQSRWLDSFVSDLTNTPLRPLRWLDGIVCDPPYGIREGCKVLGSRSGEITEIFYIDGVPSHLAPGYIHPKKPYSFDAMIDDVLYFAAEMLVDDGRLAMWMPTANDEEVELAIPQNPYLDLVSSCVQVFNKWSRRLLTYRRLSEAQTGPVVVRELRTYQAGTTADDLNSFRKKYFEGFRNVDEPSKSRPQQSELSK